MAVAVGFASACTLAGPREEAFVRGRLARIEGVASVDVSCGSGWLTPKGDVCVTVVTKTGKQLRFQDVGYDSFGSAPSRVRLLAAGGRSPLLVSCDAQWDFADIDRSSLFGHHFSPVIEAVPEAVRRAAEVVEELEFWPQCPQFWEVGGQQGTTFRYCAHKSGAPGEPPPGPCDQSLDRTK
ncbi:MAG: hypothetical protein Q8O42_09905 [Acidobacteriota bacterium]|nr:hypothetical protein [Acidobacteriota bacterium]